MKPIARRGNHQCFLTPSLHFPGADGQIHLRGLTVHTRLLEP